MSKERLPGQISGIGYIVKPDFNEMEERVLEGLCSYGLGRSTSNVMSHVLYEWVPRAEELLGKDSRKKATRRGYIPVKFNPKGIRTTKEGVEVLGYAAYLIDESLLTGFYGKNREEATTRILDEWIRKNSERISKYYGINIQTTV